jgi:hypothetical protein
MSNMPNRFGSQGGQQYQPYNSNPSFNSSTQSLSPFELLDLKDQRIRQKTEKMKLFFTIVITVVVATLIIGCFLAVLMKVMINTAKQETSDQGNKIGGRLNQWVENATDWIKKTFPPRKHGQQSTKIFHPIKPSNNTITDSGSIVVFGEGKGFSLNGLVNVFGEVIKAVNNTRELSEERKLLAASTTDSPSTGKPEIVYHLT